MKKSAVLMVSALVGATMVAPSAYARHRVHHRHVAAVMMAPPARADAMGQFYATPLKAGTISGPGFDQLPGFALATGVVDGVVSPIVTPVVGAGVGAAPQLGTLPGLDTAGTIVNGVTQPILGPLS